MRRFIIQSFFRFSSTATGGTRDRLLDSGSQLRGIYRTQDEGSLLSLYIAQNVEPILLLRKIEIEEDIEATKMFDVISPIVEKLKQQLGKRMLANSRRQQIRYQKFLPLQYNCRVSSRVTKIQNIIKHHGSEGEQSKVNNNRSKLDQQHL